MSGPSFDDSRAEGVHHRLAALVGAWRGRTSTWFEPGDPVDVSETEGTLVATLGGRFLLWEYQSAFGDKVVEGLALIGYHLDRQRFEVAWIDSFHTNTSILFSTGAGTDGLPDVLGHYPAPEGPDWGWRTRLEHPEADRLVFTAWNVEPSGEEQLALRTELVRQP